jgi:hypothetical protein
MSFRGCVAEPALDDVQGDALSGELEAWAWRSWCGARTGVAPLPGWRVDAARRAQQRMTRNARASDRRTRRTMALQTDRHGRSAGGVVVPIRSTALTALRALRALTTLGRGRLASHLGPGALVSPAGAASSARSGLLGFGD